MYVGQCMSLAEIAARVGCSTSMIDIALAVKGIPSRGTRGRKRKLEGMDRNATVEALRQFRSRSAAAAGMGVSALTLKKHCGLVGISSEEVDDILRSASDARRDAMREAAQARQASRREARQAYHQEVVRAYAKGATIGEIGAAFNRDPTLIWRILRENGVDTATRRGRLRWDPTDAPTITMVGQMRSKAADLRRRADDLDARADLLSASTSQDGQGDE